MTVEKKKISKNRGNRLIEFLLFRKTFFPILVGFVLISLSFMGTSFAMKFVGNPGSSTMHIKVPSISTSDFSVSQSSVITVLDPGSQVDTVLQDLNVSTHTGGSILTEGQINVNVLSNPFSSRAVTYSSQTPTIATVDSSGRVTRVSDGTAKIVVDTPALKQLLNVSVSLPTAGVITTYPSYANGTLGKNVSDDIDDRITNVTSSNAETYKPIFSTQDHTNSIYVRNTSSWVYGLDLTAISPWNSNGGVRKAGTLISPRHIIFANHYTIANGSKIRFITQDNVVVERTLVNSIQVGSPSDVQVGVLDSDVSDTISFAKFLPDGWQNYIPGIPYLPIPIFYTDQEEKALVNQWPWIQAGAVVSFSYPQSTSPSRKALSEQVISGDSGNPAFLIINNQLVILTAWQVAGAGAGPSHTYYKSQINAAMTSLGGGYQLTTVDLSGFSSY